MIANYGYADGSGVYYITIDTDKCIECKNHACVDACPSGLFAIVTDDYDDEVATIKEEFRKKIKYECAPCKPVNAKLPLPCTQACGYAAINHSW